MILRNKRLDHPLALKIAHCQKEERAAEHGKKTVQANCVRCHENTVEMIDQDRPCWDCHRRIMHRRSGAIETR